MSAMATDQISFRADPEKTAVISCAASVTDTSLTEFMLDASYNKACAILYARDHISVRDAEKWDRIQDDLDAPAVENRAFIEMMSKKAPWD